MKTYLYLGAAAAVLLLAACNPADDTPPAPDASQTEADAAAAAEADAAEDRARRPRRSRPEQSFAGAMGHAPRRAALQPVPA